MLSSFLFYYISLYIYIWGEGWLEFLDLWSGKKTLMELIFNPCGEFWWNPEGPVSQIHSPHLHVGASGICSDAKERVGYGRQWEATKPIQSLVKLQPSFLSLWWKTCLWQNCSLGSCACSGPGLGQRTLMIIYIHTHSHSHKHTHIFFKSNLKAK